MKKTHKERGSRVHPAPEMAALPAAVLSLAAVLTAEEQEVLYYLLSGGGGGGGGGCGDKGKRRWRRQHEPELGCDCFGCYKSFWARWDASPNKHLIHRILDAFEEGLEGIDGERKGRRGQRRHGGGRRQSDVEKMAGNEEKEVEKSDTGHVGDDDPDGHDDEHDDGERDDDDGVEWKSSVKRLVSFIGERVWGPWH